MTVGQLMYKLKKLPENMIVTVYNNAMFINGEYVANNVEVDENSNTVMIDTDYQKRIE